MTILVFDSGIGGLTILREARTMLPDRQFIYVGDDAGFPYGDWEEEALVNHIVDLFDQLIPEHQPELIIIACNTASTLILPALRNRFDIPFVGTVPAIKPAAEQTYSGMISVLGTPGTINRQYTRDLVKEFATDINTTLVAANQLANIAEHYVQRFELDLEQLSLQIQDCFVTDGDRRTDIIVLACTHYPFLINEMRKVAPWPVDWMDPSVAIAHRARSLIEEQSTDLPLQPDFAIFTSGQATAATRRLLRAFGFIVK